MCGPAAACRLMKLSTWVCTVPKCNIDVFGKHQGSSDQNIIRFEMPRGGVLEEEAKLFLTFNTLTCEAL